MGDFLFDYFINPINSHSGYNLVNTLTYAVIGLLFAYGIFLALKKLKVEIGREFVFAVIAFVLLGSTVRVVSDSVDTGVMENYVSGNAGSFVSGVYSWVLDSHIYDYKKVDGILDIVFALHSPGIYFITGGLLLLCLGAGIYFGRVYLVKFAGIGLWVPHFLLLIPMMQYLIYGMIVLVLVLLAYFGGKRALGRFGVRDGLASFVVGAHAIDGAATFTVIDIFNKFEPACRELGKCYFEQHVLSDAIGKVFAFTGFGFFFYFLVKAAFAALAAYFICRESESDMERKYILLLIIVFGLAPGVRDVLRMVTGA